MFKTKIRFTVYLYLGLLLTVVSTSSCSDDIGLDSDVELAAESSTAAEKAIIGRITFETAKAEAKVQDFDKLMKFESASLTKQKRQVLVVESGESIQAAVDEAEPGALILIRPGIYRESVIITKSGLTLLGVADGDEHGVIIQNPGGEQSEEDGVLVGPSDGADNIDGFAMYNITVKDFEENGVFLIRTQNYFIARVTTINNGEYGIFPVRSNKGVVFRSSAEGHTDAGIYIGQSENVLILHSFAYGNVLGFEIENSSNVIAAHNKSYDNTIGILAVLLPPSRFITVLESENIWITQNRVFENNRENFAEPGELASFIPRGIGLLGIGVDRAHFFKNRVTGNDLIGLGLGTTLLFGVLAGLPPEAFEGIEPNADDAEIRLNYVLNNGTNPPSLPAPLEGIEGDLFWDGSGVNNCWWKNTFDTSFPGQLPQCTSQAL